jgi:hypothetical protein
MPAKEVWSVLKKKRKQRQFVGALTVMFSCAQSLACGCGILIKCCNLRNRNANRTNSVNIINVHENVLQGYHNMFPEIEKQSKLRYVLL